MCTRGVWQLETISLRFCKQGGSSVGTREYLATSLRDFAEANTGVTFNVAHAAGRHPLAVGRYRDGTAKAVDLRNKDAAAVAGVLQAMRDVTSGRVRRFRRPVSSRVPSVQGLWDPSNTFDNFELRESSSHLASGEGAGTRSSAHEGGVPVAVGEQQQQQQQLR